MIYADTSFLSALYLADRTDSERAADYVAGRRPRLPFVFLHWPEMAKAVWGSPRRDKETIWDKLKLDLSAGQKLAETPLEAQPVAQRAAGIMRHYVRRWPRLRSLDVMHVMAAVQCQARWFLSFDFESDQRILAHTQRLKVWPELSDAELARLKA